MTTVSRQASPLAQDDRVTYARIPNVLEVPNLIELQINSFDWLKQAGLTELFKAISPIQDFTGGRFELQLLGHEFREPKISEDMCRAKELTFSAPLYVTVRLVVKETGEIKEQTLFFGDIPQMTTNGTFVINGAERVVVSQLVRSPGAYLTLDEDMATGRSLCYAKLIPYRGAWLEFETSVKDVISVIVDRKRKIPVVTLLRALGYETDEEILELFKDVDISPNHRYIRSTLDRDTLIHTKNEALIEFYRRLRPGEPPSLENANNLLDSLFFSPRRYDLDKVGRYKLNRRLGLAVDADTRTLTTEDIVALVKAVIRVNNGREPADDIDHLGNRRVRAVGELIQNQLRIGLLRMERVVRERMTLIDAESATPSAVINIRPIVASVREFFGGSQLSQFMDQTNPLAELTHKRRLSALGPGGLSRERAGFDVRDVHYSHYGRICPIETPEGPNIGLLGSMATYGRANEYGFIETPYRRVLKDLSNKHSDLKGHTVSEDIVVGGRVILASGETITADVEKHLKRLSPRSIAVKPFVSHAPEDVVYLSADEEEKYVIGQASSPLEDNGEFLSGQVEVEVREGETFALVPPHRVDLIDVSPMQIVSVSTSLIPFLEHDDANRALMGSNMQRQAVPLLRPESPLVGTGMEARVARDSGQVTLSTTDGVVTSSSGNRVVVKDPEGNEHSYRLMKFLRSNQGTCICQRPIVDRGNIVKKGDPLADSSSTQGGYLALGQNVLAAFMSWDGYNYEDAIVLSEALVRDDKFSSIHMEKHEVESRETKLGPEEITRDIPNVGEDSLHDLDEDGIIRIGAEVNPGDILVGKITPKGETELTAEEKLLRAIFGEMARDVKDTSLRVPHGERGKVIDVKILTRETKDELPAGVTKLVRVWIAQTRKVSAGDKLAGRHGNKGVISRILAEEDMPFLPDGTPVDIILNPIGVPSRMNLGQVLETHLGWAAKALNYKAVTPIFDGAQDKDIEDALARAWFVGKANASDPAALQNTSPDMGKVAEWLKSRGYDLNNLFNPSLISEATQACLKIWLEEEAMVDTAGMSLQDMRDEARRLNRENNMPPPIYGKTLLYDGRTGEAFHQPVTVGYVYIMKLIHLVEDKIHARSTGPYSLITQQPLGGKAQFGGQRFGEMEVWALEAYSAAHNLQEMLTVKSDDVVGRVKTYESIVKGEEVMNPGIPESFHVLLKELQSLGLSMELIHEEPSTALQADVESLSYNEAESLGFSEPEDPFEIGPETVSYREQDPDSGDDESGNTVDQIT